jgi:hypothetical protein
LFSTVVVLACIPTSSVWGFFSFTSLPTFGDSILDHSYFDRSTKFWFAYPLWPGMVNIFFMCFLAIWASSFEKALFSLFAYFFIWSLIFFGSSVFWVPYIY